MHEGEVDVDPTHVSNVEIQKTASCININCDKPDFNLIYPE